jgi:hypothetical protein
MNIVNILLPCERGWRHWLPNSSDASLKIAISKTDEDRPFHTRFFAQRPHYIKGTRKCEGKDIEWEEMTNEEA